MLGFRCIGSLYFFSVFENQYEYPEFQLLSGLLPLVMRGTILCPGSNRQLSTQAPEGLSSRRVELAQATADDSSALEKPHQNCL
jgi:hypothetical protein